MGQATGSKALTILVVDDEFYIRDMVIDALAEAGHHGIEAGDADEALAALERYDHIDLVFTDIKMPGAIDGIGLARMIRERWPYLPVILTSGHIDSPDAQFAADFIAKPYRVGALLGRFQQRLG